MMIELLRASQLTLVAIDKRQCDACNSIKSHNQWHRVDGALHLDGYEPTIKSQTHTTRTAFRCFFLLFLYFRFECVCAMWCRIAHRTCVYCCIRTLTMRSRTTDIYRMRIHFLILRSSVLVSVCEWVDVVTSNAIVSFTRITKSLESAQLECIQREKNWK